MRNYISFLLLMIAMSNFGQNPKTISDSWVATDALGRKLPTYKEVGGSKKDKFVGLFYWTWRDENMAYPYNTTEILEKTPEAINDFKHPAWPKDAGAYHWGEPLFGYYQNVDHWVLRKHAEMLADAGVDVIIFDCTNGNMTWKSAYMELLKVFSEARADGVNTPKVAFMLAFWPTHETLDAMEQLYKDLYKPGLYKDLWFTWKGRPFMMAHTDSLVDVPGDPLRTQMHHEMRDFFTFRAGQPEYKKGPDPKRNDQWGWLEIYPQNGYVKNADGTYEQVTVGCAQNWSAERGLTAMNAPNSFGRSYTHAKGQDPRPDAYKYGLNFQEQWDRALEINPEFIFITGWNEWIAGRYELWCQQPNAFPDEFSVEKSRDIEPMKGGFGDNYYYQMISNIRKFKGVSEPAAASAPKTIKIDGDFSDWKDVAPEFKHHKGSTIHRNADGWKTFHYTDTTGRNDFVLSKVARDKDYFYFYIKTNENITRPAKNWMMLFIDCDRDKATGWGGYDFVVNRTAPGKKAIMEKSSGGWNWTSPQEVDFSMKANEMEIRVPVRLLPVKNNSFEFKWADNMLYEGDVFDFILHGDVAPSGRFNYLYEY